MRLLILGAAVYLCACLYFGAAASYGDTTAMRGAAAAAAPRALESPTAKEAAPVPENEDPRAQNKDLHAENEDLRERLAAAEASLELAKSRALEPAPRALEPARASYGDTTAMRGGAAAAPRVLTAREGRAPRSLDVYLIVAGVQKCGTSELQQWLKRLPRVRHNNLEPHFFDCLAGGPCDKRCVPGAFRPGGCHRQRYVLNNETLDAYRRDFKPLAIAEGPKTRALEIASGEALPWLHFEKTPSYYDCADSALVRATLPNARVAFILRDPVARLWSGYFHMHETRIRVAARRAAWTAKFGPSATIPRHWPADVKYDMFDANVSRALAADFDASLARALALRGLGADHRECLPRPARDALAGFRKARKPEMMERQLDLGRYAAYLRGWSAAWGASNVLVVFLEVLATRPVDVLNFLLEPLRRPLVTETMLAARTRENGDGFAVANSKALHDDRKAWVGKMGAASYATVEAFYESDTAELRAALLARELVYPVPRDLLPPWLFGARSNASR